jgi:hypothetical protein
MFIGTILVVDIWKNFMAVQVRSRKNFMAVHSVSKAMNDSRAPTGGLTNRERERERTNSSAEDVTEDSLTRHDTVAIHQEQVHDNPTAQAEKGNHVRAKECSLGKKWEPQENHDYKCPTAWPLLRNKVGCCNAAIGLVTYTHPFNNSWCETYEQQLRVQGASLLQGKQIFFIDDSVGR